MSARKRKLVVVACLLLGAPVGWAASFYSWSTHLVDGGDDPRMLLVVLGCMIAPALLGAWRHRELYLRLICYPAGLGSLAWMLRPAIDGIPRYPREFAFLSHHQFHDFYPSLIIPVVFVGGLVAVVFTRLRGHESESDHR